MISNKRINVITAFIMAIAVCFSCFLIEFANVSKSEANQAKKTEPEYAAKIFGTDIISIQILADENDWQTMLDNAKSEQFIKADVIVNGTKFTNVGIRPKGNSSLTQVSATNSSRYSFRLQFDEYIKDQTCFGLESFVVNNMLGDNTYMKEYVSYDLMKEAGVECPYFGYAKIKVNNKDWGLYLAVELYNESYEQRVYNDTSGMLYNVKMVMDGMGGQNNTQKDSQNNMQKPDQNNAKNNNTQNNTNDQNNSKINSQPPGRQNTNGGGPGGQGGGMGAGNSGGSLQYTDDNSSSYGSIFENVIGKGTESDYQRVITAIKALSEGKNIEGYFNIDEILRYLAAHTIVVNLDSYSSSMAQNYYIYEKNGVISILPWDYNLAWGGFQSGSAASVINFPIDTPVSGVEMSTRPLLEKLFSNSEYLEKYHTYLQELIDNYFTNGKFEAKINKLNTLISEYVKNDATAFCSYEEYQKAYNTLIKLGDLRAESIQGQLDGTVPSTTSGQNESPDKLVSADGINLTDLGAMQGGGNKDANNNSNSQGSQNGAPSGGMAASGQQNGPGDGMPDRDVMEQVMKILQASGGTITDQAKSQLKALGLTDDQITKFTSMPKGGGQGQDGGPTGGNNSKAPTQGNPDTKTQSGNESGTNVIIPLISIGILGIAIFITSRIKRKY